MLRDELKIMLERVVAEVEKQKAKQELDARTETDVDVMQPTST
jgi:hypothetical protein